MSDTENTVKHAKGNTKTFAREARSRAWVFTVNNYCDDDIVFFTNTLNTQKYMFQEEVCPSTGTPHLQGSIYFANAKTFDQLKLLHPKAHWEKTKSIKGSINYCCKPETRAPNGKVFNKGWNLPEELKLITNLYDWQINIINLLQTEPDDRTINWYWEPTGNIGKTQFCKYIISKFQQVQYFTGGEAKDIAYQIIKETWAPKIALFHFPRSSEGRVSYNSMEAVKDGLVQSGKYEGGRKLFNSPHVIVFANWAPDLSKLSNDRWNIVHL